MISQSRHSFSPAYLDSLENDQFFELWDLGFEVSPVDWTIEWSIQLKEVPARLPGGYLDSVRQRYNLFRGLSVYGSRLKRFDLTDDSCSILAESIEGEPLFSYLKRSGPSMRATLELLRGMVAEGCRLAKTPRLLSSLFLNDFLVTSRSGVCLETKIHPTFPVIRKEVIKSEFEITSYWVEGIARIYGASKDGWSKSEGVYEPKGQKPFRKLLKSIGSGREIDTIEVFRELERCLRRELDSLRPDTDFIKAVPAPALGPLRSFLMGKLASKFPEKCIEQSALSSCLFGSPFILQVDSGKGGRELQQATLLPPESWFETSLIQSVNRKMANSFLAVHPNTLRTRSLLCEEDFTLIISDLSYGIALPSLIQLRGGLESDDVLRLGRKISQALDQFGSAEFSFEINSPWQIEVYLPLQGERPDWSDLVSQPSSEWPAWEVRIRVEIPTESVIEIDEENAWSYTLAKLNGKSFPALIAWMNEWRRLECAGKEQSLEREPVSWDSRIESLFAASCDYFEPSNPFHRKRLLNLLEECVHTATP